jgi:hypothetical protein
MKIFGPQLVTGLFLDDLKVVLAGIKSARRKLAAILI